MNKIFIVLSVIALATLTSSFPTGAPPSACESSIPRHGNHDPQTSASPVKIVLSQSKVAPGQTIEVKVEGIDPNYEFKGFLIQARNVADNKLVGKMEPLDENSKILDCNGPNSVTHTNRNLKKSVTFNWTAPETAQNVQFHVTIVESFAVFWSDIPSEIIEVN